jgi:adenine-specific DNA-methyltransferase
LKLDGNELVICFEYRPDNAKRKQKELNTQATEALLAFQEGAQLTQAIGQWMQWRAALASALPTEKSKSRTVLEKHLNDYTAKNTFDYFIHKDLGRFMRRELDFFIKNEVMHLDDVESETAPKVESYLARIKATRRIAHKLIDFLAQLENFQKRLWLKKKFVLDTQWLISMDRVPESLYSEICEAIAKPVRTWVGTSRSQRDEWIELFALNDIHPADQPLTPDFLKSNPSLVLDTIYLPKELVYRVITSLADQGGLDEQTDAMLVHGENFQALRLLEPRFKEQIRCIAIDPPYNRLGDGFPYKDNYRHSSWLTMMRDRIGVAINYLRSDGALFSNIDENERDSLQAVLDLTFGKDNRVEELIWAQNTTHSQSPLYSTNHEYVEVYARNRSEAERDPQMFREPKPGYVEVMELLKKLEPAFPSLRDIEEAVDQLFKAHIEEYKAELREQGLAYDDETKKQDPYRGIFAYSNAEYRSAENEIVTELEARFRNANIVLYQPDNASAPAQKQAESTKDPADPNYRYYTPLHPVTGKQCPCPKTGWRWPYKWDDSSRDSFVALDRQGRISWGPNERTVPRYKRYLHEVETNVAKSFFHDYSDGEKQLANLFGEAGIFPTPKPTTLVGRFVAQASKKSDWVMDFFGGSGTTGHAVINLNREDRGSRKFVLMEAGDHFDRVLTKRIKKVMYAPVWSDGKPKTRPAEALGKGNPKVIKLLRVESYEDACENLKLVRSEDQRKLIDESPELREHYVLQYMLDVESRGSLLSLDRFVDPFNVQLTISRNNETQQVVVDMVETLNQLLGLRVHATRQLKGVVEVTGVTQSGESVLVLWRNVNETNNAALDDWFKKQAYSTRDREFDLIYVNGDNNLENLRRDDETWKVRLIEEAFHSLMFTTEGY